MSEHVIRDVQVAVMRAGHVPEQWIDSRLPSSFPEVPVPDAPVADDERPVETWLRFRLPPRTRAFQLALHHMPTHVWIDDIEVTVAYDDGRLSLVHAVTDGASLTLQCLRARQHVGLAAVRAPLHVDVDAS